MKPGNAPLKSVRLLDQVRERIRYLHYSLSTEKVYLYWVKFFVRWQAQQPGGMRALLERQSVRRLALPGGTTLAIEAMPRRNLCGSSADAIVLVDT